MKTALIFYEKKFTKFKKILQKPLTKVFSCVIIGLQIDEEVQQMTVKEIASASNKNIWQIYYIAKKLGRLPTVEEAKTWKPQPAGRPRKRFK